MSDVEKCLKQLQEQNPEHAHKFSIDRHKCAVGLTEGETVFMLYSTALGVDGLVDCRFPDGRCHTFKLKDW